MNTLNILIEDPAFIALDDEDKINILKSITVPSDVDNVYVTWKETEIVKVR